MSKFGIFHWIKAHNMHTNSPRKSHSYMVVETRLKWNSDKQVSPIVFSLILIIIIMSLHSFIRHQSRNSFITSYICIVRDKYYWWMILTFHTIPYSIRYWEMTQMIMASSRIIKSFFKFDGLDIMGRMRMNWIIRYSQWKKDLMKEHC